jgi:hypothetical protein
MIAYAKLNFMEREQIDCIVEIGKLRIVMDFGGGGQG